MKVLIIAIITLVTVVFLYFNTNAFENIKQQMKNPERCAGSGINDEEGGMINYGDAIKRLLKGCL